MTSAIFEREVPIRFSHCDPAGIVYFPQYLILFNQHVEDWFNDCLGISYTGFVSERRFGLPIVKLDCEFKAPSKMGDKVVLGLQVAKIGNSSLVLDMSCRSGAEMRVTAKKVLVTTSLETHKPVAIPADLRESIERFSASA